MRGGKKELKYFSFIVTIRIKERLITGVRGRREIRTPTKKISIFLFEIGYIVIKFELFPRGTIIFQENNQLNGKTFGWSNLNFLFPISEGRGI